MRQERLLSVGADGGGYINLLCTNKDDLSAPGGITCKQGRSPNSLPTISGEVKGLHAIAHAGTWGYTY